MSETITEEKPQDPQGPQGPQGDIQPVAIETEMRRSYLDYAMSVIVSRALPDVRDGLKPVHRRILYAMREGGYDAGKPYKKSARIVGDVMGKYHPHGDSAIYGAMVRMAQDFSLRLPLVDGQGNFGSLDDDPPAAMRYTEARLARSAEALLEDIDRSTVDFQPNYDESTKEPLVLPARFPNLLVNGAGGIAVGMATNIPTHNLGEVIDACCLLLDNPEAGLEELMRVIPGPDFPTGALVRGRAGIRAAFATGHGSMVMRGRTEIEEGKGGRQSIIVTEIPWQLSKEKLVTRIAECANAKLVEGISDLRDESNREGVRIVIDLKRDASADVVLNQLYRQTPLQTNFPVHMLALDGGRPRLMSLKDVLVAFLRFREQVLTRRTEHDLAEARGRAHVLLGLALAVSHLDEVIALIRASGDPAEARTALMERAWDAQAISPLIALVDERPEGHVTSVYRLSENQARAILDLKLNRLTGLERGKIEQELRETTTLIGELLAILGSRSKLLEVLRTELLEIRQRFATPRRTQLEDAEDDAFTDEDLITREDMVVTLSHGGYAKRVPLAAYRAQKRGGKGRSGMATREEDWVSDLFVASTHTPLLFFSSRGMAYVLKVHRLPLSTPQARGKALVNLLPLQQGETITAVMTAPEEEESWSNLHVLFATKAGTVRRNRLSDFGNIRANGLIAMKLEEGDSLIGVKPCQEHDDILLATRLGRCIRFPVGEIRLFAGRSSVGVRGVRLAEGDEVVTLSVLHAVEASVAERAAYLRAAIARRRAPGEEDAEIPDSSSVESAEEDGEPTEMVTLSPERLAALTAQEEMVLTIFARGYGRRSSAYEYRVTRRGGQGILNRDGSGQAGEVVTCMPVTEDQDVILGTQSGQVIRLAASTVRQCGRQAKGVILFRLGEGESVASVATVPAQEPDAESEAESSEQTPPPVVSA
ncbi:MAG: DNA gyrase subunit A [Alphaproteobacteria bacterium]|nr:MAG: DNA gyrase subunit A [Alphaproteobacteria bacterium]